MNSPAPSGVLPDERLASLDILRGLALFGVVAVNLVTAFRVSIFQQFLPQEKPPAGLDQLADSFVSGALELKAFALFSLLFGVGLAIQFDRLSAHGRAFYWIGRRLAVLLLFGLLHLLLIWNGDILTEYAFAGFLVLPFLSSPAWVLAVAFGLLLTFYTAMPALHLPIPWPAISTLQQHVVEANQVYATGGYSEILRFSFAEIPLLAPLHIFIFPRTVALFLLGALIWRAGVLRRLDRYKGEIVVVACASLAAGASLGAGERLGTVLLALGYAAVVMALLQFPAPARLLNVFAQIGRMAFTSYVMQSLILGFIFFGYGLGQFGHLGPAQALLLAVGLYVGQMCFSAWWLSRFRFGPLEWLWRTMMYGRAQQMRK